MSCINLERITWQRLKTVLSLVGLIIPFPAALCRRKNRTFGEIMLARRDKMEIDDKMAKMINQNQRKIKIFSLMIFTGSTHIAS